MIPMSAKAASTAPPRKESSRRRPPPPSHDGNGTGTNGDGSSGAGRVAPPPPLSAGEDGSGNSTNSSGNGVNNRMHSSAVRRGSATASAAAASPVAQSRATQSAAADLGDLRERRNWLIHQLYTRQEYLNCLAVIEAQLRDTEGTCEYALYVKGLLKRMEGKLTESLGLLQAAVLVGPENTESRKQFGRALFLLGRHDEALEAFREVQALVMARHHKDWEVELHLGLCLVYLGDNDGAVSAFIRSIGVQRIDSTFLHLGRALVRMRSYDGAIQVFQEALEASPENPELQAALGQLYLKTGATDAALACFNACLAEDQDHLKALVASASITQTVGNFDAAIMKYRAAVGKAPDSPQLWNNIGTCFFGKQARMRRDGGSGTTTAVLCDNILYSAVSCLRKSIILAPFEWITNYNLGIVFLFMGRYVSAFHYLSAAISLNNNGSNRTTHSDGGGGAYAPAFMYLGVCLSLMNDSGNACQAYERALSLEDDLVSRINYAVTLLNSNLPAESAGQLRLVLPVWSRLTTGQQYELGGGVAPHVVGALQARLAGVMGTSGGGGSTNGNGNGLTNHGSSSSNNHAESAQAGAAAAAAAAQAAAAVNVSTSNRSADSSGSGGAPEVDMEASPGVDLALQPTTISGAAVAAAAAVSDPTRVSSVPVFITPTRRDSSSAAGPSGSPSSVRATTTTATTDTTPHGGNNSVAASDVEAGDGGSDRDGSNSGEAIHSPLAYRPIPSSQQRSDDV